jgi:mannose-6-phosphate isomerase-like protein (cupin superfamily)
MVYAIFYPVSCFKIISAKSALRGSPPPIMRRARDDLKIMLATNVLRALLTCVAHHPHLRATVYVVLRGRADVDVKIAYCPARTPQERS